MPLPRTLSATGKLHRIKEDGGWRIMTPRHAPAPTLEGHLTFALKYEGLDLAVLKRLFATTGPGPIEEIVREKPTGGYARRIWFLYEWLTDTTIDMPDATAGRYVPVLDPDRQYAAAVQNNVRVLNDTGDFYRYFDATPHAEFLYNCVRETIEQELPQETAFLKNYDSFRSRIGDLVDMPDRTIDLLFRLLHQNGGILSKRAREKEFRALTHEEAAAVEAIYKHAFNRCDLGACRI